MRRETRKEAADVTDILIAQLSGRPVRVRRFDVVAFSKQDRAAFARVARIMRQAREALASPDSDTDYEMGRLEHAAAEFAGFECVEVP